MRQLPAIAAPILVALAPATNAQAALTYSPARYKIDPNPRAVEGVDLDHDGKLDLVVLSEAINGLQWLHGDGAGGFAPAGFATPSGGSGLALGDLNGDGFQDAVVSNYSNGISVSLGNAQGQLSGAVVYPTGGQPRVSALGDWNLDGKLDAVVANYYPGAAVLMLGDGMGGFSFADRVPISTGFPVWVAVADVDGNGFLDAAVAISGHSVALFRGLGGITLGVETDLDLGVTPQTLAFGDLDGDGRPDLATGNFDPSQPHWTVSAAMNLGNGTFGTPVTYTVGYDPQRVVITDLNHDAKPDLVVVCAYDLGLYVLLGDGAGRFADPVPYDSATNSHYVCVGDWNGDGHVDAATVNYPIGLTVFVGDGNGGFRAPVRLRTAGGYVRTVAAGDWNRDGYSDVLACSASGNSITAYLGNGLGAFASTPVIPTGASPQDVVTVDFDGDGVPDLAEVNIVSGDVWVYFGDGHGDFGDGAGGPGANAIYTIPPLSALGIAAGDLTGDGRPDLIVTANGHPRAAVFTNNGSGGLVQTSQFGIGASTSRLRLGDLNNDGLLDLVATQTYTYEYQVLLGLGFGQFSAPNTYDLPEFGLNDMTLADLDGDGKLDLALTTTPIGSSDPYPSGRVGVKLGNGAGSFGPDVEYQVYQFAKSIKAADVDGSGTPDLIVGGSDYGGTITVRFNDGTGHFPTFADFACGFGGDPMALAVTDFDLDGVPDTATGDGTGAIAILLSSKATIPGVYPFGAGAPGCFGAHHLFAAGAPKIHQTLTILCDHAAPLSLGLGLVADAKSLSGSSPFGLGIPLYVDLLAAQFLEALDIHADSGGASSIAIPVPNNPSLLGSHYTMQTIWVTSTPGCLPSPFGLSASNGLELVIQP
jgi:hypothetical protein